MRVVGIDFGQKRIGVAISDPLCITAQPVTVIAKAETFSEDIEALKQTMSQYDGIEEIVVGLPKTMKGEIGISAQKVQEFVEALRQGLDIKILTYDERLTTAAVEKTLISAGLSRQKRKKVIDKSAATFLLQSYLDTRKKP
ncbi:MAG: Holliday junction resolvase RuvX [Candidatus Margulisbacteria bacterium]|nr:Holliday junction resolvase RuvX [Candidatus Margulisiibacteriota bacterium]